MDDKVAILGAGVSGLALAHALRDRKQVTVFEKNARVGGWVQTVEEEGFLFECGPHSLRPHIQTLQLIEELGLQGEVILPPKGAKKRYLFCEGKLRQIRLRSLWKGLWKDFWAPRGGSAEETIFAFASRRFGEEIAKRYFDPMTLGIFAGDCRKLSVNCCFPHLVQLEQRYGSVVRGWLARKKRGRVSPFVKRMLRAPLYSFREGMETLPKALATHVNVACGREVVAIEGKTIFFSTGKSETFDMIYSALPAHFFTDSIPFVSLAVVHLGYRKRVLKQEGFGHLVPTQEGEKVLGVIWDSSIFPQQNREREETRLTVMMRSGACVEVALEAVQRHLGIACAPDVVKITLAKQAIPQYEVGHESRVEKLQLQYPNLTLLGSSYCGVSLNDVLSKSATLCATCSE